MSLQVESLHSAVQLLTDQVSCIKATGALTGDGGAALAFAQQAGGCYRAEVTFWRVSALLSVGPCLFLNRTEIDIRNIVCDVSFSC